MKEPKFLGAFISILPNFSAIMKQIAEKYNLPKISPDDDLCHEAA